MHPPETAPSGGQGVHHSDPPLQELAGLSPMSTPLAPLQHWL